MIKFNSKIEEVADLLADIGVLLMSSGANSPRVKRNVKRMAHALNYDIETFYTPTVVMINTIDRNTGERFNIIKNVAHMKVNFDIVSEISILSWKVTEKKMSLEEIRSKIESIRKISNYKNWVVWGMIGIATATLCRNFGGDWTQVAITFIASSLAIIIQQFFQRRLVNPFMCWLIGSFSTVAIILASGIMLNIKDIDASLTASVLWLIPGIPLINAFIDILGGHIISGSVRSIMGTMMVFMIAIGFFIALYIFKHPIEITQPVDNVNLLEKIFLSGFVSLGFAILFVTPIRALWAVWLLGAIGYATKFLLLDGYKPFGIEPLLKGQLVTTTVIGAAVVGVLSLYFAHRVHTPPVVFSIPAVINMIPGKMGYEFMFGVLKIISIDTIDPANAIIFETLTKGLKTGFMCFGLAFGIAMPLMLLKSQSVKGKDLHKLIRRNKK